MFENLELQLLVELSSVPRGCFEECVAVSQRTGVDVYYTSQSQILAHVLEYMTQIRIFTVYCHLNK